MELKLPLDVAINYSSPSQRIRVMTEYWVNNSIFCPNCGKQLSGFENNAPVADFYCKDCTEEYELKSKGGTLGKKIVDGAYGTEFIIKVRDDVLEEEDGPVLQHGLKGLHENKIILPNSKTQWPSQDALAWRYDKFISSR